MTRVQFSKHSDGHFYLPISIRYERSKDPKLAFAFVDTGASKYALPREVNEREFQLKILGTDKGVNTALQRADFDWVVVQRMTILEVGFSARSPGMTLSETDLKALGVKCWLGDSFSVGMKMASGNFFQTLSYSEHNFTLNPDAMNDGCREP